MYIIRLDDASDYMDVARWQRIENLLDKYEVKPLVGIIPENHDPKCVGVYGRDEKFWSKVKSWERKKWTLALHGWHHVYTTKCVGINPAGTKSEFAGIPFERQCMMIREGMEILKVHDVVPTVFFAPSHTYDRNTIEALRKESNIRIISDTVSNDVYVKWGFHFIPVQISTPRKVPFKITTICLHPNTMNDLSISALDSFLVEYNAECLSVNDMRLTMRKFGILDFGAKLLMRVNRLKNLLVS